MWHHQCQLDISHSSSEARREVLESGVGFTFHHVPTCTFPQVLHYTPPLLQDSSSNSNELSGVTVSKRNETAESHFKNVSDPKACTCFLVFRIRESGVWLNVLPISCGIEIDALEIHGLSCIEVRDVVPSCSHE